MWNNRRFGQQKKYGNRKVEEDGLKFDSVTERDRYLALKARVAAKEIFNLTVKPAFPIVVDGEKILDRPFHPEFAYTTRPIAIAFDLKDGEEVLRYLGKAEAARSAVSIRDIVLDCLVVEDCKGYMDPGDDGTKIFRMKQRLVRAIYGIEIAIVQTLATERSQERRKARRAEKDRDRRLLRKLSNEGR